MPGASMIALTLLQLRRGPKACAGNTFMLHVQLKAY